MTDDGSAGRRGLVTAGVEDDTARECGRSSGPYTCCNDEIRVTAYKKVQCPHRMFAQHHNGRRNGYVWSLPCECGRQDAIRVRRLFGPEFDAHRVDF